MNKYELEVLRNENKYADKCKEQSMKILETVKTMDEVASAKQLFMEYSSNECIGEIKAEEEKIQNNISKLKEQLSELESMIGE